MKRVDTCMPEVSETIISGENRLYYECYSHYIWHVVHSVAEAF